MINFQAVHFAELFRGTLTKLAETFFASRRSEEDGWRFMIGKYQGVYFIKEFGTSCRRNDRKNADQKLASFLGKKFETRIFAENGKVRIF